jgi:hypothetical protein
MATRKAGRTAEKRNPETDWSGRDIMAVVIRLTRESYLDRMEDLKYYAAKVKHYNELKKAIREYLQVLRCVRSNVLTALGRRQLAPPTSANQQVIGRLLKQYAQVRKVGPVELEAGLPDRAPPENVLSLEQLAIEIEKWEGRLVTMGDDAQLANVDLQNVLQQVQQFLQMMSNVSKLNHDNAMAIIRKLGG